MVDEDLDPHWRGRLAARVMIWINGFESEIAREKVNVTVIRFIGRVFLF